MHPYSDRKACQDRLAGQQTIMAGETSAIVEESKKQTCTLVEEDVPFEALPRENVE